jgi:4-hydroxy-3-methylbut-2-enyl diphosphate reductase
MSLIINDLIKYFAVSFLVAGIAFIRALANDLHDIQKDMFVGRETIPTYLGKGRSWWVANLINAMLTLMLLTGIFTGILSTGAWAFVAMVFLIGLLLTLHLNDHLPRMFELGMYMDGIIGLLSIAAIALSILLRS